MKWNWIKKGLIFQSSGQFDWMTSHTTPVCSIVLQDRLRVFFSSRTPMDANRNFVSQIGYLDVDKTNLQKILGVSKKPVLDLGNPGTFDEFGCMVAKPVVFEGKIFLYYMGWQRLSGNPVPYQVMLGLAISEDHGETFYKVSSGPVLGIDHIDPVSIGNVSVIVENGVFKMWYTTFTRWELKGVKPTPNYVIKYAESKDGINWVKSGQVCINEDYRGGVATPSVFKWKGYYHMWFGFRPPYDDQNNVHGYNLGYAYSVDGINWTRNDNLSELIGVDQDWESKMKCYPFVFELNNEVHMLYCGNDFGRGGFGFAKGEILY